MLDYYDALDQLISQPVTPRLSENVFIENARNRIIAEDIMVQHNMPIFDNSAMDGYAICGNECEFWEIIDRVAAGDTRKNLQLTQGQAIRIFTGAPTPEGTTAVLIQEEVEIAEQKLTTQKKQIPLGLNIRRQAEELKQGKVLLEKGHVLNPVDIGLLASQGHVEIPCFIPLTITVFSSGNEVIEPTEPLVSGKIFDANRYMLISWLKKLNINVMDGGILPDNKEETAQRFLEAANQSDAIICSGGVSVGEEDHIKDVVERLGKLTHWKLAIKPGKPFAWGELNDSKLFLLPGNPVASFVTFMQVVQPVIRKLSSVAADKIYPRTIKVKANFSREKIQPRREFLRAQLTYKENQYWASPLQLQGSTMLSACSAADVLIDIPPHTAVKPEQELTAFPISYRLDQKGC